MYFKCNAEELKREFAMLLDLYKLERPVKAKTLAEKLGIKIKAVSGLSEEGRKVCRELAPDGAGFDRDDGGGYYLICDDEEGEAMRNLHLLKNIGHIVLDHSKFDEVENAEAEYFARYCMNGDNRKETG